MKGKFRNKIIGSCMVIVCLVAILFVKGILTEASDTTTEEIQLVTITDYTSSALEEAISNQRANNYLYAGLYKSGTTKDTLVAKNVVIESKVTEGSTYVAKFLPEGVMGIKAQVSEALLSNPEATTSSVRFVTAVDSVLYKEVGFSITREGDTEGADPIQLVKEGTISKYVYEKLYGVDVTSANPGEPLEYTPKDIHALANYFKTYTITNVPETAYNKDLTVTPYWITYDGVTVEGTTGIKSVNFGRSWVYINTSANTDEGQYGTYDHPYTDLADALNAIVLEKNGKIVIQSSCANSTFTVPNDFSWEEHGKDLTITGEGKQTETLDFSAFDKFRMGDSVTFENMILNLPTGQLYADGHRFKVAKDVVSNNSQLIIFGGGNGNKVTGDTNVTLFSGSYERVYGGGLNGDVEGDTYVTIENVDIYDPSSNTTRFVFGGGRNADVTGNTHVTVGEGFNSAHNWQAHGYLSAVFGGGHGDSNSVDATVNGNTYVIVKDGAKTNYVHGAGMSYSKVLGTSHVTIDGGYAMSVYGGGSSKQISNGNTVVVMKSGTVEQIFGGNQNGMTGNADVHILGGDILRRVYAGCYNEYEFGWNSSHAVTGYTSVTFGPDTYASLAKDYDNPETVLLHDGDATYYAVSRRGSNYSSTDGDEIGVFVVNDYDVEENPNKGMNGYTTFMQAFESKPYHYLVNATAGGAVYSEGDSIRIVPGENKVATVRVNSPDVGNGTTVHAYLTSEGVCKLPTYDSSATVQNVFVVFTDNAPSDVKVSEYVATADGTHYRTLEEAINVANTLSTTTGKQVVVNLLKENITVDNTLNIVKSAKIKIQNAKGVTATVNRADGLMSSNLLKVEKGAELSVMNVILDGRKTDQLTVTDINQVDAGGESLINVLGDLIIDGTTIQYAKNAREGAAIYVDGGSVTMEDGTISNNYASGTQSGGAVSLNNSATFTMKKGAISNNIASASGGAFMVRTGSTLTINDGTISDNEASVSNQNGGGAIYQHRNTTIDINGGTISNNTSQFDGGAIYVLGGGAASTLTIKDATISGNKADNSEKGGNGAAVYVGANCSLTLEGGAEFSNNTANANGGALAVLGTVAEKEGTSCTFTGNQAVKGGAIYVSGAFTMGGASIAENTASESGGGVYTADAGNFTMTGGSITANTATLNGSGVYVGATGEDTSFTMSGGTISGHGNSTTREATIGTGVYVAKDAKFFMNNKEAIIEKNYSGQYGAGVAVYGIFEMTAGKIQHNDASNEGAGVYIASGSNFTMSGDDSHIQFNNATSSKNGGGVIAYGTFNLNGGKIHDNSANKGAGVFVRATGKLAMTDGEIYDNIAQVGGGGLFTMSANTTVSGGTITSNEAVNGAGLYLNSGDVRINLTEGAIISDNTATGNGGGIYIGSSNNTNLSSHTIQGEITSNEAQNGGGIYVNGNLRETWTGLNIHDNTAQNGGGLYVESAATITMSGGDIYDNTATNGGGGVYTHNRGAFTMTDGSITQNTAQTYGSGVYVGADSDKPFIMSGGAISEHGDSERKESTVGTGVYVASGSVFNMTGASAVIQNNYSSKTGAGVAVVGTFSMSAGTIQNNYTATNGGGVYVNGGKFTMSNGTITNNATVTYGAGVYLDAGEFNLNGGSICNHGVGSATEVTTSGAYEGAGICAAGTSVVNMSNGTVSNNYVSGSGAGVAIRDTAQFIMAGGTISDNTAEGAGGAMIVRSTRKETVEEQEILVAAFIMNAGTISGNSALRDDANGGGAIFQSKDTRIEIHNGTISGNRSSYNGGAIFANAGTGDDNALFLITGGSIKQNTAAFGGGGVYVNSGICNMTGGTISEHGNKDTSTSGAPNGAGVYVASSGTFNMSGDASVTNNYTSGSGAGVYVAGAFNMNGGTISSNKSTGDGAGVYLATDIGMEIDGGTIINNTTSGNGGAIAAEGNNALKLTSGEISGNSANGTVQGIFLSQVTKGTLVTMNVDFNMGTNDMRFQNVSNADPILEFVGGETLSHYTVDNKLQIGLHNGAKKGSTAYFECQSKEAATKIIQLIEQTEVKNNNWSFDLDEGNETYIKATKQ